RFPHSRWGPSCDRWSWGYETSSALRCSHSSRPTSPPVHPRCKELFSDSAFVSFNQANNLINQRLIESVRFQAKVEQSLMLRVVIVSLCICPRIRNVRNLSLQTVCRSRRSHPLSEL